MASGLEREASKIDLCAFPRIHRCFDAARRDGGLDAPILLGVIFGNPHARFADLVRRAAAVARMGRNGLIHVVSSYRKRRTGGRRRAPKRRRCAGAGGTSDVDGRRRAQAPRVRPFPTVEMNTRRCCTRRPGAGRACSASNGLRPARPLIRRRIRRLLCNRPLLPVVRAQAMGTSTSGHWNCGSAHRPSRPPSHSSCLLCNRPQRAGSEQCRAPAHGASICAAMDPRQPTDAPKFHFCIRCVFGFCRDLKHGARRS